MLTKRRTEWAQFTCPICLDLFEKMQCHAQQAESRGQVIKFCSAMCRTLGKWHMTMCKRCSVKFLTILHKGQPKRNFCSKSCAMSTVHASPRLRELARHRMLEMRQDPEVAVKLSAYLSSDRNPFKSMSWEERSARSKLNWPKSAAGLAKRAKQSPEQLELALHLPGAATGKFIRMIDGETPKYYFPDLLFYQQMLVVEVDGGVHRYPGRQEYDQRRTDRLEQMGWSVMRFWNSEITRDTAACAQRVRDRLEELSQSTA